MQLSLDSKRLYLVFCLCLFLQLTIPQIIPQFKLNFMAPFVIISCYQKSRQTCLWMAFLCGIVLDLLTPLQHFGLYALDFCLALLILYPQRRNFFADSPSTLPIMTFFYSFLCTLIMGLLMYGMETRNPFSWPWAFTDLLLLPAVDSLYAFFCFIVPCFFFGKPRRRGKDYFI